MEWAFSHTPISSLILLHIVISRVRTGFYTTVNIYPVSMAYMWSSVATRAVTQMVRTLWVEDREAWNKKGHNTLFPFPAFAPAAFLEREVSPRGFAYLPDEVI